MIGDSRDVPSGFYIIHSRLTLHRICECENSE